MEINLRETVNLHQTVVIDGTQVLRMTAEVHSDLTNDLNTTISVTDYGLYVQNLEECRKEIEAFRAVVRDREDALFVNHSGKENEPSEETE